MPPKAEGHTRAALAVEVAPAVHGSPGTFDFPDRPAAGWTVSANTVTALDA